MISRYLVEEFSYTWYMYNTTSCFLTNYYFSCFSKNAAELVYGHSLKQVFHFLVITTTHYHLLI